MKKCLFLSSMLAIVVLIMASLAPSQQVRAVAVDRIIARFEPGNLPGQTGIRPSQPDLLGEGPQAFAVAEDGTFFILDSYNERVIWYDPLTHNSEVIPLPAGTGAIDLALQDAMLYVLDARNLCVLKIDQSGEVLEIFPIPEETGARSSNIVVTTEDQVYWQIANRKVYLLLPAAEIGNRVAAGDLAQPQDISLATKNGSLLHPTTRRLNRQNGLVELQDFSGKLLQTLPIHVSNYLGSTTLIGMDTMGNYYVLVEELLENGPEIVVETTIWRFSPSGGLLGIARLPLEESELLPHRFVVINLSGEVFFMGVKTVGTQILQVYFQTDFYSRLADFTQQYAPVSPADLPKSPYQVTREQIIQTAEAYLNANWLLAPANYHSGPANNWNGCASSEHWRLPRYLDNRLNQIIQEVPYQWGGKQSVSEFKNRINNGYWAGNICKEAVLSNAAGIDCSGFVQNSWGTNQQYLPSVAHVIDWSALQPGDLLFTEAHSILFGGFVNGSDMGGGIYTYEATTTSAVDRVVHWTRGYSEISGYTPYRYNDVAENNPAQFGTNASLHEYFDSTGNMLNADVCADNMVGHMVNLTAWRRGDDAGQERWFNQTQYAGSNCITFTDIDGVGDVIKDRPYRIWVSLDSSPQTSWAAHCLTTSGQLAMCTEAQYPSTDDDPLCYILSHSVNPANGGVVSANPTPNCRDGTGYREGTQIVVTALPNPGYSFAQWAGDAPGAINPFSLTMNANKAINAQFSSGDTAELQGQLTLEGRLVSPADSWVVLLEISLTVPGSAHPAYTFRPSTDNRGRFTLSAILPGTYEMRIKNRQTLRALSTITLLAGTNTVDLGTLKFGDANDDNTVTLIDFSILSSSYNRCPGDVSYDARADFNGDHCVTLLDFSMLVNHYQQAGAGLSE